MPSPPKIAIVGAGPAGLTIARLLYLSKCDFDVTVFETDASPTSRVEQGGTLDLHTDTGLAALRKCDLWDAFQKYARYDGEEMIMADKNATVLVHIKGAGGNRPEIDRYQLKEILLESVPKDWVKWGRKLREVTAEGLLNFDGVEEMEGPFDLVVGADGAWSKVRGRLTDVKPVYSGVSGYELEIFEPSKVCPRLNSMVGRGGFLGSSDCKFLNAQRIGNGNLKVRSWFLCSEGEAEKLLKADGKEQTRNKILQRYQSWAPEMTELLKQSNLESLKHYTLYELPVGTQWTHQKGFTLIGDASSLATPFSGEGVNKAMVDALELAEFIEKSQDPSSNSSLDEAVLQYEERLFPRSEKLQAVTMGNRVAMFGPNAPIGLMTHMLKTMASGNKSVLARAVATTPVVAIVYCYFWVLTKIGMAVRKFWRRT